VGGGIVGLTTALELKRRLPDSAVTVIEKEPACGLHASGRNSGVLHAGFYYSSDSFKARFSRDGNRELTAYCDRKGLAIRKCGKLVVARSQSELPVLEELLARGASNGVPLERVTAAEASEIEPTVKTVDSALYSPTTSSVAPEEVMRALESDAEAAGIGIRRDSGYLSHSGTRLQTRAGPLEAGYVVNAAGLYADTIAQDYGFGEHYRILPFKGRYLTRKPGAEDLRTHIYPLPDLRYPFLGVHFTVAVDGKIKIGPTALPAMWREQYKGFHRFKLNELSEIGLREAELFLRDDMNFRRLAWREVTKISKRRLLALASRLAMDAHGPKAWHWGRSGIRAQLFDTRSRLLETDFVVEGDDRSFHVLNAVSPAFTCALPFARYIADQIELRLGHAGVTSPRTGATAEARA
jgi:L-2-hydroxyglutarate oxidase LhgO